MIHNMTPQTWPPRPMGLSGSPTLGQTRCYKCPGAPPMMLLPQPSFSTCVEVDASECGAGGGGEVTPGPGGGGSPPVSPRDGPSQVTLTVMDPVNEVRIRGANVSVAIYVKATGEAGAVVTTGVTDGAGQFYFERMAPSPNVGYQWQITVSPGPGSPGFDPRTILVDARTNDMAARATGEPERMFPTMNVCVAGSDPLVCEVADAQLRFKMIYEQQLVAWNYESSGRPPQIAAFAADQAHAAITFTDPRLAAHWSTFSWWVGDQDIPARDWPALIDRVNQVGAIFSAIPFPAIDDLFIRCARGIPLANGFSIANPRFYTDTFNAPYWPKEGWQIQVDMAGVYTINMKPIFLCIEHKFRKEIRELERSRRAWEMISFASVFALGPMAGAAGLSLIVSAAVTTAYSRLRDEPITGEMETLVAGIVSAGVMSPEAIAELLEVAISALISDRLDSLNPIIRDIAVSGSSQLAAGAIADYTAGLFTDGAQQLTTLQSLGSSVAAVGIRIIANMIKAEGIKNVEGIQDTFFALQNVEPLLVPYLTWAINTLLMGSLFNAAVQLAADELAAEGEGPDGGTPLDDFDMDTDVVDPMIDAAEAAGVDVPGQGLSTLEIAGVAAGGVGVVAAVLAITGTI